MIVSATIEAIRKLVAIAAKVLCGNLVLAAIDAALSSENAFSIVFV